MGFTSLLLALATAALLPTIVPARASAHCDSMDGPVVLDARVALEQGDIGPVLKWINAESEVELRSAFDHALDVRQLGDNAATLADQFFFETAVRLHRESENAPYTGLKPAGTIPAAIQKADAALVEGNVNLFARIIAEHLEQGILDRFEVAHGARADAGRDAESGRAYVHAYVQYVHYIEALHAMAHTTHAPADGGLEEHEEAASGSCDHHRSP